MGRAMDQLPIIVTRALEIASEVEDFLAWMDAAGDGEAVDWNKQTIQAEIDNPRWVMSSLAVEACSRFAATIHQLGLVGDADSIELAAKAFGELNCHLLYSLTCEIAPFQSFRRDDLSPHPILSSPRRFKDGNEYIDFLRGVQGAGQVMRFRLRSVVATLRAEAPGAASMAEKARQQQSKERGRKRVHNLQRDLKLKEDWEAARRHGTLKSQFVAARGLSVENLNDALARLRSAKNREKSRANE